MKKSYMSMIFTTVNPINKEELGKEFITIRVAINTSVCVKTYEGGWLNNLSHGYGIMSYG